MDKFYKTPKVQELFNNCSRDYVSKLARSRRWRFEIYQVNGHFAKRYLADDVEAELNQHQFKK